MDRIYERIETLFDQENYHGSDFEEWMQDSQQELSPEIEKFAIDWDKKMNHEPGSPSIAKKPISAEGVERTGKELLGYLHKKPKNSLNACHVVEAIMEDTEENNPIREENKAGCLKSPNGYLKCHSEPFEAQGKLREESVPTNE